MQKTKAILAKNSDFFIFHLFFLHIGCQKFFWTKTQKFYFSKLLRMMQGRRGQICWLAFTVFLETILYYFNYNTTVWGCVGLNRLPKSINIRQGWNSPGPQGSIKILVIAQCGLKHSKAPTHFLDLLYYNIELLCRVYKYLVVVHTRGIWCKNAMPCHDVKNLMMDQTVGI